jgi:fatty-acyl-CoA synthase
MQDWGTGAWLKRRARTRGDQAAYEYKQESWTYEQARARTAALARALRELGVRRGDRVGYLGPNHPALLETLFATAQLGAAYIPMNFRLSAAEINDLTTDADCRVIVHTPDHADVLNTTNSTKIDVESTYETLIAAQPTAELDEPVGLDDIALVLYTSGTTGRPKGVMLTHANLAWNAVNVLLDMDVRPDERALIVTPMFHTAALNMVCLPVLMRGGRLIIHDAFDPATVLRDVTDQRVTLMFGVPATYDRLAADPGWPEADLSSVRTLLCGGAPVPDATIRAYLDRGLRFLQGYGMTETSPGALLLDEQHVLSKAGSAGVPMFFTDVAVVRPDGTPAAAGENGEVVVQGPNVFAGYRSGDPPPPDGWFHSGDVAVRDEDGYAYITDRLKDMIISGGENIYPAEIENVLRDYPGVGDCAVIGVPDPAWGEVPRAVIVPAGQATIDPDGVRCFLRARLAHYKVPKSVVFAAELPRTATGKISKREVRQQHGTQQHGTQEDAP